MCVFFRFLRKQKPTATVQVTERKPDKTSKEEDEMKSARASGSGCQDMTEARAKQAEHATVNLTLRRPLKPAKLQPPPTTWRPRGLSKSVISRVILGLTPFRVLIALLITYLLSSLGLQVASKPLNLRKATALQCTDPDPKP